MEPSVGRQLGTAILGWLLYFLVVYFVGLFVYSKVRGAPPNDPDRRILYRGKTRPAQEVFLEREQRLRRIFTVLGTALVLLPLILPWILRWIFQE